MTVEFKRNAAAVQYAEGDPRQTDIPQTVLTEGDIREFFRQHPTTQWLNMPLPGGGFVKLTRSTFR